MGNLRARIDRLIAIASEPGLERTEVMADELRELLRAWTAHNHEQHIIRELIDFAEGVEAGHDVPQFFRREANNVARHRALYERRRS